MNDFTDFYRRRAAECHAEMLRCSENADLNGFKAAEREFETYRQAAGLPKNWRPNDETE